MAGRSRYCFSHQDGPQGRGYNNSLGLKLILRRKLLCAKDWNDGKRRNDRVVCARAAGCLAVEFVALADRGLAGSHLDSRWTRSYTGRSARGRFDASRNAWINARPGRGDCNLLPGGRRARRPAFRLRHRPVRPQEIVLHHGCGLSHWHSAVRVLLELLELRILSGGDRRRYRRRIRCDQFRD